MSIVKIRSNRRPVTLRTLAPRDCGDSVCELDWLASRRHTADLDSDSFTRFAMEAGWGDGLPLIAPTEARIQAFLRANARYPDEVICTLPPARAECTVEKIAVNAVMAGAQPDSLELIIAALLAIAEPDFELYGVNTTTAPVFPAFVVNGPIRHRLSIPYSYGCFGGAATPAVAIGRAIRLLMRNVAGQVAGDTSQTTFGSPARVAGLILGEWEEKSPWAPLAERRVGLKGDAVTSFGAMGTMNVLDTTSQRPSHFLEMIGKSLVFPGNNGFSPSMPYGEVMVALNPICADIIGKEFPKIEDVQELLWTFASVSPDWLQSLHRDQLEAQGRVREDGRIYLTPEPKDILLFVAGGLGGLHATALHTFGSSLSQTCAVVTQSSTTDQAAYADA